MSKEFEPYLPMGKKLIEYYIYLRKLKDIEFTQTFNGEEIGFWSCALLHFLEDMGTDDEQNALSEEELEKKLTLEVPRIVE